MQSPMPPGVPANGPPSAGKQLSRKAKRAAERAAAKAKKLLVASQGKGKPQQDVYSGVRRFLALLTLSV